MAKDPAFLFYYQDFLVGTDDLTNEEVGAYIRCLCFQAAKGGISEKHMKNICITHDIHNSIKSKFTFFQNENIYKNERLSEEIQKRKNYSNSRANNRLGKKGGNNISKSYVPHMENENKDENEIGNIKEVPDEKFIIPQMCSVWYKTFPSYTSDKSSDFEGMGKILKFISGQAKVKTIENRETQDKILATLQQVADCVKEEQFWVNKPIKSIANNIQEFYNKIKNPINGTANSVKPKTNGSNYKTAGAEVFADRLKGKLANLKTD